MLIYPLTGSFLKADNHNMAIVHGQAYCHSLRLYHPAVRFQIWSSIKSFTFLLSGFREPRHYYYLPYFVQSYEFSGAHMASSNPVASKDVWYAIHSPIFLFPLFFPIPSACSFLLGRAASTPSSSHSSSRILQPESSSVAVRKCFEPLCAYTLQSRT